MRAYFDSSALVAAIVAEEEHHEHASEALSAARAAFTCNHSIAEVFGTLTGGRLGLQLSPAEATEVVEANIIERMDILELTVSDYRKTMAECQTAGARGGAIFDMLHLHAARRGKAARIFTINVRHFQAFAPDLKDLIALPR